jgi:hypothetical protein
MFARANYEFGCGFAVAAGIAAKRAGPSRRVMTGGDYVLAARALAWCRSEMSLHRRIAGNEVTRMRNDVVRLLRPFGRSG